MQIYRSVGAQKQHSPLSMLAFNKSLCTVLSKPMLSVADACLEGKDVLLVVDYNVQIINGKIACPYKIDQTFRTIDYIIKSGFLRLTIASHLGRPKNAGECPMDPVHEYLRRHVRNLRFRSVAEYLEDRYIQDEKGRDGGHLEFSPGEGIFMVDNIRHYDEEALARFYKLFDVIVSDAFGCAHRSTPFRAYAGLLMAKEVAELEAAAGSDLVIMGGAKIADKLKILENFNARIFVGGCLSQTILKSLGHEMGGRSRCEEYDNRNILGRIVQGGASSDSPADAIILPVDYLVIDGSGACLTRGFDGIRKDDECIDIGERSLEVLRVLIAQSKRIFWNGPVGKMEDAKARGTGQLVKMLESSAASVVLGGGETLAAACQFSRLERFRHVSTGGGAMLQFLSGGHMPGLAGIIQKK